MNASNAPTDNATPRATEPLEPSTAASTGKLLFTLGSAGMLVYGQAGERAKRE